MNSRAQVNLKPAMILFTFMVVTFMAVILFASYIYISGQITTTFDNIGKSNEANAGQPGYINLTLAANQTFDQMNASVQGLRLVAICLVFGMIIGIFVSNALVKMNPIWFGLYVLIVLLALFLAAPIANAYNVILNSGVFGGQLTTFSGVNFVMQYLPLFVAILGLLGGAFIFMNILRGGETL